MYDAGMDSQADLDSAIPQLRALSGKKSDMFSFLSKRFLEKLLWSMDTTFSQTFDYS